MINKDNLIKNLKDFENLDKYSLKQFAKFLCESPIIADFYKQHVEEMNNYIKKYPKTIVKFSKDINCFYPHPTGVHYDYKYQYSEEERKLICDIIDRHLLTFWTLNFESNYNLNSSNCKNIKLDLVLDIIDSRDTKIQDLIDYIIKFCIIPYSKKELVGLILSTREKDILKCLYDGLFVPQIAEKLGISIHTVEKHKKNICKKIDDLNLDEYKAKKALAKLQILARKIFN